MKLVNIGYGNLIAAERVISVVSPDAAPIKRMISNAKELNRVIDASCGKSTKSVIITDSDHIVLSAIEVDKLLNRFTREDSEDLGEQ